MKHTSSHSIALLALVVPALAVAQTDGEGRLDDTILSGEDRDATRLGEDAWRTRFQGLHAESGACGDPDAVWAFAPNSVDMGRTICTSLGKMTWEDDALVVPMSECRRMGADVPDMVIALSRAGDDAILLRMEDEERRLEPCPPPG